MSQLAEADSMESYSCRDLSIINIVMRRDAHVDLEFTYNPINFLIHKYFFKKSIIILWWYLEKKIKKFTKKGNRNSF